MLPFHQSGPPPAAGAIVHVRQRLYLVEEVKHADTGDATLVRLSCIDDDAQGQALDVLWEHELDGEIRSGELWQRLAERSFDPVKRFAAYLNTLRWNCVTSTDPKLLQSPFRAGIRLDPYQLEPLRKALRLPRVNLFIADDVGLGKTIEAGLIARELLLRKKVREVVVSCPPSMLLQWQEELSARFGLQFEILDKAYVQKVRRERGFSVNPWTTHSRFLISHRLLIDEAYTASLRDWLKGDSDNIFRAGTLLILDEAHHAAPSSGQKYAIDSQMTHAVRDLAQRFEHRLFLSATPHNGHSNSFTALLEILDPQRFIRGTPVTKGNLKEVVVRRIKEDLRQIQGGFPERVVEQITLSGLPADQPELELARLLSEYQEARLERLSGESKRVQATSALLLCGLQQRLFSSIEAFARTLGVHRKTVERQRQGQALIGDAARLKLDLLRGGVGSDDDRAEVDELELGVEVEAQVESATATIAAPPAISSEQRLLDQMAELAEAHRRTPDARVQHLLRWIKTEMCPEGKWNPVRIIIFTEYEDTLRYLDQQLGTSIADTSDATERIAIFRGSTPNAKREEIKAAFNADPDKHPVRILLATDAAREGLNLQAYCNRLFHFDVPWNPSRMEQRNGRIDRKLQPAEKVYCSYFVYAQRPEDRILETVLRKTKTIREELGSLSQVIDGRLDDLLKFGIRRSEMQRLTAEIEATELSPEHKEALNEELESSRERQNELRVSIDQLRTMMERSKRELGLDEEHFRSAISCALEMLKAPPLIPGTSDDGKPEFILPKLDDIQSSWAETMDSLRTPRPRDQKLYEWRRSSAIRPIVFEDPGKVTDQVVQLHLEQNVVRRLLGRFLSQGFVHHDLSRACLAQTRDAIPRVILLGRLALYGAGAARLHEEIVPITARWIDPAIRNSALTPYAREAESRTMDLLDQSLMGEQTANQTVEGMLRGSAARDIEELLPHLQARGEEYARDAIAKLDKRGEEEATQMRGILEAQKKHIIAREARYEQQSAQKTLPFHEDELRQVEADRRNWNKRLSQLDAEIEVEPDRVRKVYEVRAQRIEPVGLVYLCPASSGN
jgi:superfamily II DNA or RNA helicase